MKGKTLLQTVDLSKKEKGVQPILVKDDPNHTLLSVYEDLKLLFIGSIKLAAPKKEEGKSWKDTELIQFYSPVEGDISEVSDYEYENQVKPKVEDLKNSLENLDLDDSDPDDREKLFLLEAFKFPEGNLQTYFVKVGSYYVMCNWGLENAPEVEGLPITPKSKKSIAVNINVGEKNSSYIFKAEVPDSEIKTCEWNIDGQELTGEEITEEDIDFDSLSESFNVNLNVQTKDNQTATTSRFIWLSDLQGSDRVEPTEPNSLDDDIFSHEEEPSNIKFKEDTGSEIENEPSSEQETEEENEILAWLKDNWKKLLFGLLIFLLLLWLVSQCSTGSVNHTTSDTTTQSTQGPRGSSSPNNNTPSQEQGGETNNPDNLGNSQNKSSSGPKNSPSNSSQEPLLRNKDSQTQLKQKELPPDIKTKQMERVGTIYRMEYEEGYLYWLEVNGERHLLEFVPFNESEEYIYQNENPNQNEAF